MVYSLLIKFVLVLGIWGGFYLSCVGVMDVVDVELKLFINCLFVGLCGWNGLCVIDGFI